MRSKFVTSFIFILLTASWVYLQTQNARIVNVPIPVVPSGTWNINSIPAIVFSQTGTDNNVDANITNASLAVTGTFWQATQPVSLASLPALATGSNTIGAISNTGFNINNFPATQAISISAANFPDNEPFNINQINSVTPLMGAGATGTGSQRITLAELAAVSNNPAANVSLGSTLGKTNILKTGVLATTATTADQVILTYTVTSGKTLYVMNYDISFSLTTAATTANCGNVSLESPSGTKIDTNRMASVGNQASVSQQYPEPIGIAAGTVFRFVVTPCIATSTTWTVSFAGYEK